MTSFFKRLLNPGGRPPGDAGAARLTLAVFGKHPAWKDHIPGIGVETEALAHVKHAMYVSGIGGRIDAGAWKSLEAEKRLEGFKHVFLWLRDGHVMLGRLQSSEDGLHRKEYPLVLCADAEGISPEKMLSRALPELDRLLNACQATSAAEQVSVECRMAQDRLRDQFLGPGASGAPPITLAPETRRRFIEHPDLGPERVGLLRVLHELGSAGSRAGDDRPDSRPHHLRLPLAADSRQHALLLWAGFLQIALPPGTAMLLVARDATDWVDAVVGEPDSDDFFCLQASLKAQPLATQIPYDLSPELKPRLQKLEGAFLGPDGGAASKPNLTTPPGVPPPSGPAKPPPPPRKNSNWVILVVAITIVVAAVVGVWLVSGNRGSPSETQPLADTSSVPAEAERPPTAPSSNQEKPETIAAQPLAGPPAEAAKIVAETTKPSSPPVEVAKSPSKTGTVPAANAKAQARAGEEDLGLAQIALAQGNYARALEISQKWAGNAAFKEVLARISTETNQLSRLRQSLLAGNYAAIVARTNPLPENASFQELLTQADAEFKLLGQAQTEFAKGDYAFVQRPELQDLKSRPPFQKLLQAGAAEAESLKQAQALKTQNQPQAAHDLITQNKLTKPPFADVEKWARLELDRTAGQTRDQQQAETLFRQGDYAQALALCEKYSGIAAFDAVVRGVQDEQASLTAMTAKLAVGDYTFLGALANQSYRGKLPFADLQRRGVAEQATLTELGKFKQANDWPAVQSGLAKQSAEVLRKKPFAELELWSQDQAAKAEAAKSKDPGWLDADLEVLLVQFNILSPNDRWLQTEAARKEKPIEGMLAINVKEYYLNRVRILRDEYTKRGWINQRDRKKYLDRLESNLEIR